MTDEEYDRLLHYVHKQRAIYVQNFNEFPNTILMPPKMLVDLKQYIPEIALDRNPITLFGMPVYPADVKYVQIGYMEDVPNV